MKKKAFLYSLLVINLLGLVLVTTLKIMRKDSNILNLCGCFGLIAFFIFLIVYIKSIDKENTKFLNIGLICITLYGFVLINNETGLISIKKMPNFTDKSYVEVVKWASKNNITLKELYEYSDLTKENNVIYQSVKPDKEIENVKELKIVISNGINPSKEIMIPDMTDYDLEKVLDFIEKNGLSDVEILYEENDVKEDHLIKQSKIGSTRRDEKIVFTFSRGNMELTDEITMIDFTNQSKLRVKAFLAKYEIKNEFTYDYSDSIKKDYVMNQSIKKGTKIKRLEDKIIITLSKGSKIKAPDFKKMSLEEITEWSSKNKVKLDLKMKYDDSVKEGKVISSSVKENDSISEGDTITVTISKGQLKMIEFDSVSKFEEWAKNNNILYTIEHEFSDSIENGKIIKFTHKKGDVIKNNDTVSIYISDGKKTSVPNFIGMSKNDINSKCNNIGIKCSFQYQSSNKAKDIAIRQSIAAGSDVASNTTVSIILSSGKTTSATNTKTTNNSSSNNSGKNNNPTPTPTPSPTPTPTPEPSCEVKSIKLTGALNNIFSNAESYSSSASQVQSYFANLNVKISIQADDGAASGTYVGGIGPGSTVTTCCPNDCKTYTIIIGK